MVNFPQGQMPQPGIGPTGNTLLVQKIFSLFEWLILFLGAFWLVFSLIKYVTSVKNLNKKEEDYDAKKEKLKTKRIVIPICIFILCFIVSTVLSWTSDFALKPIIYLYPETEEKVEVILENEEALTCTYPKYEEKWEVIAKPNGDLVDAKTGRNLYALYWEGKYYGDAKFNEGFCVKGEDSIEFLEEKLEVLGLTEREAEEFIVYWLPKLEKNKYNLIRFKTKEEIESVMPLTINPKPDTLIRVMMEFKGTNKYRDIKEQILETPVREGFVAVEWGGSEIK